MEKNFFHVIFYYNPTLPEDPAYKINFFDENDDYNPFNQRNKFFECDFLDKDNKFKNTAAIYLIESDIHSISSKAINKHIDIKDNIYTFTELIKKHNLNFKTNNIKKNNTLAQPGYYYSGFAKVSIDMQTHSVNMFFQLVFMNTSVNNNQLMLTYLLKLAITEDDCHSAMRQRCPSFPR